MKTLFEQYRPQTFDEVVGQDKAIRQIETIGKRGLTGRAFWLSGQSGTGKTTLARIIASLVADDIYIDEIDAGQATPGKLAELERTLYTLAWGRGGKCIIINEAHGLSKRAIRQLLVMLERLPDYVCFIFTTTCEGQELLFDGSEDTAPLLSRCVRIDLARRDLAKPFAKRCQEIATKEGLNGQELKDYVRLAQTYRNNMRAMLQAVESGAM
jgi:DNA polymerase-3 subunit gamma/tau